jgi:hypothetical protein
MRTDPTIVDGLFVELMAAARPYMTPAEMNDVQELLDEAQYELALEAIVDAFVEGGKSATDKVFTLITRLTNMLQLPLDNSIEKIDRL